MKLLYLKISTTVKISLITFDEPLKNEEEFEEKS